ncbi:hypothetical protein C5167_027004 [Papaver somniferum]|uniref:3-ketoacyl-CoA synthase 4-like n=1 Tax=Papaver somniferum TaxID=3469 RepID=UPI000E6F77D1|nr:3-ketoacyl-CoA synthase 4-like [Papaver somniferum]RZC89461.1 hypothetical protein C5167_027004 [Papaver somniferum]
MEFQRKIVKQSGLGDETSLPEAVRNPYLKSTNMMVIAREEAEQVMFGALDILFSTTSVKPKDMGILVVNSSLFSPTPSLSAMIINKYKLRGNIKSFNLGGMGCSAGVISADLAKDMLQVHRNTYAIVVCTENITHGAYSDRNKSMMLSNCLFCVGGAATCDAGNHFFFLGNLISSEFIQSF